MAHTADYDRWNGPNTARGQGQYPSSRFTDVPWHPFRIVLIVLGFMVWWPIGVAILLYTLWSRKMGCWNADRMQYKMDRMRHNMERCGFGFRGFNAPSSGNRAFDEYRMETLRRLEDEQKEFKNFLERLRHAKDKEEFDAFMAQHRTQPTPPNDRPQERPQDQ
ncbi:DUF2852 domain-containing protein [Nitrobacter sp.]|uniref:DUF2852 domain-containing protein n=1 Tax=unclassified Nitrobacter TaxID=2620411 RepID=UPI002C7DC6C1|nr:DUF2852 domain-containing protein [Nitrobacter sp.]